MVHAVGCSFSRTYVLRVILIGEVKRVIPSVAVDLYNVNVRCGSRGTYTNNTGAHGNGILIFLKVRFLRRNNNFNLEFDRACVRSFYDGANFHKVLDTPQYALKFQSAPGMGGIF